MISKKWLAFVAIIALLVLFEAAQLLGWVSYTWITRNLSIFIVAVVLVSLFSVIGAMFLGMYVSHRFFSMKGFTPFEEEMLRVREDVKQINEKLKGIEDALRENGVIKKGKQ
jgi:MFS superfamily sulfate permease-like transporter